MTLPKFVMGLHPWHDASVVVRGTAGTRLSQFLITQCLHRDEVRTGIGHSRDGRAHIHHARWLSLLPADYCQLELPFDVRLNSTELDWNPCTNLGCKALHLKAGTAD